MKLEKTKKEQELEALCTIRDGLKSEIQEIISTIMLPVASSQIYTYVAFEVSKTLEKYDICEDTNKQAKELYSLAASLQDITALIGRDRYSKK